MSDGSKKEKTGQEPAARRAGPKGRPGAAPPSRSRGRVDRDTARPARAPRSRSDVKRSTIRAGVAFVALALVVGAVYWYGTRPRALSARAAGLEAKASAGAAAAGCSAVRIIAPYPDGLDRAHVGSGVPALPPLSSYPSTPPASGPHEPTPLDAGVYATVPPIGNAIHSLEHGAVIVWYAPASAPAAKAVGAFFALPANRDHVIVAPYDYPDQGTAGSLPGDVGMALVAWHRIQTCRTPNLPVAVAFVHGYSTPTRTAPFCKPRGYRGDAPEACLSI